MLGVLSESNLLRLKAYFSRQARRMTTGRSSPSSDRTPNGSTTSRPPVARWTSGTFCPADAAPQSAPVAAAPEQYLPAAPPATKSWPPNLSNARRAHRRARVFGPWTFTSL